MKKLNRKGFTLIELLAVIVILAVVMVVTIPSVINSMNSAREKQLKNAADAVSEWLSKNYEIDQMSANLGTGSVDQVYTAFMTGKSWTEKASAEASAGEYKALTLTSAVMDIAGVGDAEHNIKAGYAKLVGSKICVTLLTDDDTKGSFYVKGSDNKATSTGCDEVTDPGR